MSAMPVNPLLEPFGILIGQWILVGSHPMIKGTLHGRASIEWMEGGAFLIMRSEIDEPGVPTGVMVLGGDDSDGELSALYFDERGVSRKLGMSLKENVWRWWRNAPGFSQRYSATLSGDGRVLVGKGELCRDGVNWEPDLDLTYTRVEDPT